MSSKKGSRSLSWFGDPSSGHGHHFAATEEVTMLPSSAPVPFQVVGIAGSLRQGSYNRALLRAAQQLAPAAVQIRIHDLSEIPFFNEDVERAGIPSAVARVRAAMT